MGDLGRVEPVVLSEDAGEDGDEELMAIEDAAFDKVFGTGDTEGDDDAQ